MNSVISSLIGHDILEYFQMKPFIQTLRSAFVKKLPRLLLAAIPAVVMTASHAQLPSASYAQISPASDYVVPFRPFFTYTVTPSIRGGSGGGIDPSTPVNVGRFCLFADRQNCGKTSFTLTPSNFYTIDSIGGTCPRGTLTNDAVLTKSPCVPTANGPICRPLMYIRSTYTTSPITSNCTVVVWNSFIINSSVSGTGSSTGGSIDPLGNTTVSVNTQKTYKLNPATGYTVDSVESTCGGGTLDRNTNTYTTNKINTANPVLATDGKCTVVAKFKPAIAITPTTLNGAVETYSTSTQFTASGGTAPYTWSVLSGSLPAGLTLGSDGKLSGMPTKIAGNNDKVYNFAVQATDKNGAIGTTASLSFTVYKTPIQPIVSGNKLIDKRSKQVWTPHGSTWPGLEYACAQGWKTDINTDSMSVAASWGMDVARIPLNQDCWLGADGAPTSGSGTQAQYQAQVQSWVTQAHAAGMVVIFDLHWTAPSGTLATAQYPMADNQSATFWSSIAAAYKNDPSVMFELFNEPYSPADLGSPSAMSWSCWRDGGCQLPNYPQDVGKPPSSPTYTVTGMASMITAVRNTGAAQPVLLGGLNWASDLSQWLTYKPNDLQIVAAWHNYKGQNCSTLSCWNSRMVPIAAQVPVLMTEFGHAPSDPGYMESVMTWADSNGIGYLPFAWWDQDGLADDSPNLQYGLYEGADYAPSPAGRSVPITFKDKNNVEKTVDVGNVDGGGVTYKNHLKAIGR